ncbi:piRNA biogenesis protein EXD1-like isoform X2 [Ostrea edulis]|nr:piRNA biogenesis protein EXD1-like isoform X2 [Ostrea edulis]
MPRINVVSSVPGAESVVRQLLCEPVVGVSCQGTKHTNVLTSVTIGVPSGDIYVFDVKSCSAIVLDGGLIRLLQSVELVKVFHDVSIDSRVLQPYGVKVRHYFDTQVGYSVLLEQKGFPPRKINLPQLCKKYQIGLPSPDQQEQKRMGEDVNYWAKRPLSKSMLNLCAASVMALGTLYTCLASQLDPDMWAWFDCMSEENRLSRIQQRRIQSVKTARKNQQFMEHLYEYPVSRLTEAERQLIAESMPETRPI